MGLFDNPYRGAFHHWTVQIDANGAKYLISADGPHIITLPNLQDADSYVQVNNKPGMPFMSLLPFWDRFLVRREIWRELSERTRQRLIADAVAARMK